MAVVGKGKIETYDDKMVSLVAQLPGFGGLYYDVSGTLVVRLVDVAQAPLARVVLLRFLEQELMPGPQNAAARNRAMDAMRVEAAEYDFRQLRGWYTQLARDVLPLNGVNMGDIDEVHNRIVIGVDGAGTAAKVAARIAQMPVPFAAVEIGIVPPTRMQQSLRSTVRPVIGGLQLSWGPCTMTYNVARRLIDGALDPNGYFLTNSHCTDVFGETTGMSVGQATWDAVIGTEHVDPPLFTSAQDSRCPSGLLCRYSDAALFIHNSTQYRHGYVAWPPVGSINFAEQRVIIAAGDPVVGIAVHKVGRTTGRTTGTVTRTCVDFRQRTPTGADTGRMMLCQAQGDYTSAGGDSGSPVLQLWPDGTVVDLGIHWGSGGVFSPSNAWNAEIRAVTGGGLGATVASGS
jgi:hypothetical protein